MGRKAGGKNFGNMTVETVAQIQATKDERAALPQIFTCIQKDFISIQDMMDFSGLSYETCSKIIREIKAVSDTFHIAGCIHRADYYMFLSKRWKIQEEI